MRPWPWFCLAAWVALVQPTSAQIALSNVTVVNVTPSSFSVVWSASADAQASFTPVLNVFADAGGQSNLAGQVGLEYYPLNSGAPSATNAYQQRLSQNSLRQASQTYGLAFVRVSGLNPGTTYYYQVQESDTVGDQAASPPSGPLPSATTAQQNGFVLQSLQLVISVPPINPPGSIVTLTNANTPSVLAAVVGDGAGSNQVYFSLSDVLAASGQTNYATVGDVDFTANVLGNTTGTAPQTYSVIFSNNFTVGQGNQLAIGSFLGMSVGSTAVQAGQSGSVPIGLTYGIGVTNLTFNLTLPANAFSALSVQALSSQVSSATLQAIGSNLVSVTLATSLGQSIEGPQTLAQLNFTVASNQPSSVLQIAAQSLNVANNDGSLTTNVTSQAGQLIVVGQQAILQSMLTSDGQRILALYGIPWASYEVQSTTNLTPPAQWSNLLRVPLTNLVQIITGLNTNAGTVFYRAYQFHANPPVMDVSGSAGSPFTITAYGLVGTNYTLQSSSTLSAPLAWHPLLSYTLTNSFQSFNIAMTNAASFFRLLKP